MRFIRVIGEHLVLIRLPVYTEIILVFWFSEINESELRSAAHFAMAVFIEMVKTVTLRAEAKCANN